jgi:hypothetical protein
MSVSSDSIAVDGFEQASDESVEPLSRDKIFHILQTQRRRDALRFLKEVGDTVEMRDLAEQVAAWENDTTVRALTSDERQRVYIALYQSHLPKLESEGIIRYNKSRGIVERGPLADQFDPYLDTSGHTADDVETNEEVPSEDEIPWLRYYRVVTAIGVAVMVGTWMGIPPLTLVPNLVWNVLIVTSFTALSIAQHLTSDE